MSVFLLLGGGKTWLCGLEPGQLSGGAGQVKRELERGMEQIQDQTLPHVGQISQLEEQPPDAALQQIHNPYSRQVVIATLGNNKQRPRLHSVRRTWLGGSRQADSQAARKSAFPSLQPLLQPSHVHTWSPLLEQTEAMGTSEVYSVEPVETLTPLTEEKEVKLISELTSPSQPPGGAVPQLCAALTAGVQPV